MTPEEKHRRKATAQVAQTVNADLLKCLADLAGGTLAVLDQVEDEGLTWWVMAPEPGQDRIAGAVEQLRTAHGYFCLAELELKKAARRLEQAQREMTWKK